jgi:hypothetical protein
MSQSRKTSWRIAGEEVVNCNWGCPCQFNALPTYSARAGIHLRSLMDVPRGLFGIVDGVQLGGA